MARRGERGREKEGYWRQLVQQWRDSGHTIRDFCARRGLSEPSFYAWRRIIATRDRQGISSPKPVGHLARPEPGGPQAGITPLFVPVRVSSAIAPAALEVVLRDGRVLRVPVGFDAGTLRQLLAVLDEEATSC